MARARRGPILRLPGLSTKELAMADSPQPPESAPTYASESPGVPAPSAKDLKKGLETMPEGPNIEADPGAVDAARGQVPPEGPHAKERPAGEAADPKAPAAKMIPAGQDHTRHARGMPGK
jgi:hypothetical protein